MPFDPISAAALIVSSLVTQSINARRARVKNLSQFSGLPSNDETRAVPEIVGEVESDAPALLDWGDYKYSSVRTEFPTWLNILSPITAIIDQLPFGYRYYLGLDFGLCKGPGVVLTGVKVGERLVWEGESAGGSITIAAPGVFGGEGGIYGVCDFYPGSDNQQSNSYWKSQRGRVPAYRDTCHLVVRGPSSGAPPLGKIKYSGYVSRSPQLKPWKFRLRRIPSLLGQPEYATVSGRLANPVEYMFEKFTSELNGMGLPPAMFDLAAWRAAAQAVHGEGIGVAMKWDTPAPHGEVIELMRQTIDCVFYTSLAGANAGLVTIKLIRDDYDVEDLPVVNVENASEVSRYVTRTPDDTPNDIRLDYVDATNGFVKASAMFQGLANRHLSEAREPLLLDYPVGSPAAAQLVVTREAVARTVPLKEVDLKTNFEMYGLQPGDPFVFNWPEYGVEQLVLRAVRPRVGPVGTLDVTLGCVEDRFKTGDSAFGVVTARTGGGVTPPALQDQLFFEVHSTTQTAPPPTPATGDSYVVPASGASGVWAGHGGELATWDGAQWVYQSGADLQNRVVYDIATGQYFYNDGGSWSRLVEGSREHALEFEFDGFGQVLTTSIDEAQVGRVPWDCKIKSWRVLEESKAPVACTCTFDVRKDTYANYPPAAGDSMTGTGVQPFVSGPAVKNEGEDLTDWTSTTFAKGDVPRAALVAVTLAKKLKLVLTVEEV